MSSGRPASTHMTKKVRKKSGKKRDGSTATFRGSQGRQVENCHQINYSAGTESYTSDDDATKSSEILMDTSESITYFLFHRLPELCKLRIWSFLKQCDLGRCMLVCTEWYCLIQNPYLWSAVNFNDLPHSCLPRDRSGPVHTESVCHHCFRKRVFAYSKFLSRIHPKVHEFQFCLDISHPTDQFSNVVEQFLSTAELTSLTYADINWKDSPSRASLKTNQESDQEYMCRYRKRQRIFSRLFDKFVSLTAHLTTLVMPFDWTDHNTKNLCTLTQLENLVLEKYGIYNHLFCQDHLDMLLGSLKNLKKLLLEVWIPTCNDKGMQVYHVESTSLTFLDVSQCRGFYLKTLHTPNLLHLRIARWPLHKNFIQQQSPHLPCMYSVLSSGAPKLQDINGHHLGTENLYLPSEDLNSLMSVVCCCVKHNKNSGIEMYGM